MRNAARIALVVSSMMVMACVAPPPAPAPRLLHVPEPPARVIELAAHALILDGFEPAMSDASAGILTAHRQRGPQGNVALLTCDYAKNSISDIHDVTTFTVSLSAKAAGTGSDITIATTVHNDYSSLTGIMALPANDKDCVSNGTVEKHITTALQATATQL